VTVPSNPSSTMNTTGTAVSGGVDPELLSLPAPPKRERTATVVMMALTAVAAAWMTIALLAEARYALAPGQPVDVGDLTSLQLGHDSHDAGAGLSNRYVRASGLLGTSGAIRYGRAAEGDSFRLAPVAGNPDLWVEIRVPEGFEGPRFVPPTRFAGRLTPFRKAGVRHVGLVKAVRAQTEVTVPDDAWLLVDGSSPRASRWAAALAALFAGFAVWNVAGVARVLSRVRDDGDEGQRPRQDSGEAPARGEETPSG
jgi:hypothetical protein